MGKSAFGTLLKRGDGALRTLTLATVVADQTVIIQGVTFTAHATTTTAANREYDISGTDAASATELASLINDSTYGITGLTADVTDAVITLENDGVLEGVNDSLDSITGTAITAGTITDAAATETFTSIGEITGVTGPNFSMESIDTTNHSSPNSYREVVRSFKAIGEISCEMNFDPTSTSQDFTAGFLFDFENRTFRNWQIVYPTSPTETFAFGAFVTGFVPTAPVDGKLGGTLTLMGSGAATQS